jgi:hypothetical protein
VIMLPYAAVRKFNNRIKGLIFWHNSNIYLQIKERIDN